MRAKRLTTVVVAALSTALISAGPSAAFPFPDPGYQYTDTQADGFTPVGMNPCAVHPVQVNLNGNESGLLTYAQRAITRVAQATGLSLYYEGATTNTWASPTPSIAALATAPILISFESNASIAASYGTSEGILGITQAPVLSYQGFSQIPWFRVAINADAYLGSRATDPANAERELYTTLIHEIAHGVGLAHTADPTQIMFWQDSPALFDFNQGDRTGLANVGHVGCSAPLVAAPAQQSFTQPSPPPLKKKKKKKRKKKRKRRTSIHRTFTGWQTSEQPTVVWKTYR